MLDETRNNIHFINIDNVDGFIYGKSEGRKVSNMLYKYMPLDKAIKTLKSNALWLANPIEWEDPFEKLLLTAQYKKNNNTYDFPFKDSLFATCLTRDSESEANWKLYSKEQIGVLFKVNIESLVKELEAFANYNKSYTVIVGKVVYKKEEDIRKTILSELQDFKPGSSGTAEQCAKLMLLKRNAFKSDNEIRIIVINGKKSSTRLPGIPIKFKDKTQLFPSIKIAPGVDQYVVEMIRCYFEEKLGITKKKVNTANNTPYERTRIERSCLKDNANRITINI